jgi:hypothetical protein
MYLTLGSVLLCPAQIRPPSDMTPTALKAEVRRCTRADDSVGLASVCSVCHHEAGRAGRQSWQQARTVRAIARSTARDIAAKLARGECECDDEQCHRAITADDVGLFEWDHLVQSFDDPDYKPVSSLVDNGHAAERCDRERAKCRLLYFQCHRAHTAMQIHLRAVLQLGGH